MDRAHRLGQRRTVNVYRLLVRWGEVGRLRGRGSWHLGRRCAALLIPVLWVPPNPAALLLPSACPHLPPDMPLVPASPLPWLPSLPQVRGTLEEQIMSLQRFKLDVAATLVNADNMSLVAMDTGNLLDVFTLQEGARPGQPAPQAPAGVGGAEAAAAAAAGGKGGGAGLAALLAGLGNLEQSEAQYAGEFDLHQFQAKLAQQPQGGS